MFDHSSHLSSFADFNSPFMNGSPFINPSLSTFSFDTGSPFDRLFPLSSEQPFSDINFGRLIKDVFSTPTTGVVHNIPIKIEGEGIYGDGDDDDYDDDDDDDYNGVFDGEDGEEEVDEDKDGDFDDDVGDDDGDDDSLWQRQYTQSETFWLPV
ncbi:unnamed protein product [Enterobius vermicularis]|uniref:Ovule protein n=1 Tax=Enterobius vermicularis TaxID=51028 RepID=A0A0N4VNM4_ENTVE|nr:unnamed protein product [Enterobius vermicularis]